MSKTYVLNLSATEKVEGDGLLGWWGWYPYKLMGVSAPPTGPKP